MNQPRSGVPGVIRAAILILVGIAIIVFAGFGAIWLASQKAQPSRRDASAATLRVRVAPLVAKTLQPPIVAYGTLRARRELQVSAELSGRVTELHPQLRPGGVVAAGERLFRIDPQTARSRVARAEANVEALGALVDQLVVEQSMFTRLGASLRALVAVAEAEQSRLEKLRAQRVGTSSSLDQARRLVLQQQSSLIDNERRLAVIPARRRELGARIAAARCELAEAELQLTKTVVDAPFDARVTACSIALGSIVRPSFIAVVLSDRRRLELVLSLSAHELATLAPAVLSAGEDPEAPMHPATVRWLGDPAARVFVARVDRFESIDPQSRAFRCVLEVDTSLQSAGLSLRPGMFCAAELPGRIFERVYELPRELVEAGAVLVARESRLARVPVVVRRRTASAVIVSGDFEAQDQLVLTRLTAPRSGQLVEAINEGSSKP